MTTTILAAALALPWLLCATGFVWFAVPMLAVTR